MDDVDLMLGNPTTADRKNKFLEMASKTGRKVDECPSGNNNNKNLLNPFADQWDRAASGARSRSPSPRPGDPGYGRPEPGSLTEARGIKAHNYINKEIETMSEIIRKYGHQCKQGWMITFGELFHIYVTISDKIVGLLLRARKHGLVDFEGEMLYQRRDDNVLITLFKEPKLRSPSPRPESPRPN